MESKPDREQNVKTFWETQTPQSHHIVEFNKLEGLGVSSKSGKRGMDFEVVEQRHGKVRWYPHIEQLSLLIRAINLEFRGGLPDRLARVDQRADDFHKIVMQTASLLFCAAINGTRQDELRLYSLPDHHLVCRPTIVQQITEEIKLGPCHHFKFYAGDKFFQEIGKLKE